MMTDVINVVVLIGSVAGALIAIGTVLGKMYQKVKKLVDNVNEIKEHTEENYMNDLRLIIMSPYMPIGERLIAGEKYLENDGNGEVKAYYKQLEKEYLNEKQSR
jgi:hypothetical protein